MQPAISPTSPVRPRSKARTLALAVGGGLLLALCAGGVAVASAHAHGGFFKQALGKHIHAALDAVDATAPQRDAIHAARDHVFATVDANRAAARAQLEQLLALWVPDDFDATQAAALAAQHQALAQKTGDAIVQALSDAHDALTAAQRQKLGDYLRAHEPSGHHGGPPPFAQRMLNHRVDSLLDQIKASADQRDKVHATVDKLVAQVHGGGDHAADFDQAIALFTADTLDRAQVAALQAKHLGQMQAMGGAIRAALTDLHATLDAGQRQQVADFIRAQHGHGG